MDRSGLARVTRRFGFVWLLAALLAPVLPTQVVRAATTVLVSPLADSVGACATSGTGTCSLRDAVLYANAHAGTVISVPAGTYTLTLPSTCTNNDANCGDLNLTADMTISGAGAASTIIQASATDSSAGIDRVFRIDGGTATISGVTVRNGKPSDGGNGGGIFLTANGLLTLNNVTVSGNEGTGYGCCVVLRDNAKRNVVRFSTVVLGDAPCVALIKPGLELKLAGNVLLSKKSVFWNENTAPLDGNFSAGDAQLDAAFKPKPGSPLIGAGKAEHPDHDQAGKKRPTPCALGAFEPGK